ncbi:(2Fe-2S)-binding protein [Brachyspira hyodysenteriae]|uniref:Bacterioferritin-associated ferredoxin n=4 Tax=Brachyspira TaxID=29521 RepID=A0A0G4K7D4_9SPIR|nr:MULTISPECIES: (2Fe-2S)-binding protein [Brachyspira]AEM21648.1 Fer2 BFD, BFD-like [2Fe-2S] binding domain protein [Brachyspira intermedia PWS/A]ANN64542.1 nitrite reductase [Brachyspira hyodysenteriae ATCC 27164]AUJ49048.1 nitrite reductase [Brachyspira hyodysenteriae]KLI13578.1 nitrite reductase [Brachyspira hyodysenteriae]KLI15479.1 nitrite reductase [Brachyspira hyodysenteriae]
MADKTICFCMAVTENQIRDAIKSKKLKTVEEVSNATKAGTGCGGCQVAIKQILDEMNK